MEPGTVIAMLRARAKAGTRAEWERAVARIWDDALQELKSNPGFLGLIALWNNDDSREVSVMGIWDSMENRLAYEARSSTYVRGLFNQLFEQVPDRPRFIVSRAHLARQARSGSRSRQR